MGQLKKKPKPFSAMKKVLYGDVQSRRVMVFASLILVILGCLALYSAMQNEEWTQDEPTQRKVFFLASVLLISSIALCYYALNGELEENEMIEAEHLTEIKFDDYQAIKSQPMILDNSFVPTRTINSNTEDKYLKLLQPGDYQTNPSVNFGNCIAGCKNHQCRTNENNNIRKETIEDQTIENRHQNELTSSQDIESRNKSLIVELLPLLPLELSGYELSNSNISTKLLESLSRQMENQRDQTYPDLSNPFNSVNKHSDAG